MSPTDDAPVRSEILDEYVGVYQLAPEATVTLTRTAHGLMAEATGDGVAPMRALSEAHFVVTIEGADIEFRRGVDGHVVGLSLRQQGTTLEAAKVG